MTVSPFLSVMMLGVKPKRLAVMLITGGVTAARACCAGVAVKIAASSRGKQARRVIQRKRFISFSKLRQRCVLVHPG